jgi:hypothetical protein
VCLAETIVEYEPKAIDGINGHGRSFASKVLTQSPHGCMHDLMLLGVGVHPNLSQELFERPSPYGSLTQAEEKFEVASAGPKGLVRPTHLSSSWIDDKIAWRLGWRPRGPFLMWIMHVCRSELAGLTHSGRLSRNVTA